MLVFGAVQASVCYQKVFFELFVSFLSRVAWWVREVLNYSIELNITPKSEKRYLGSCIEGPKSEI